LLVVLKQIMDVGGSLFKGVMEHVEVCDEKETIIFTSSSRVLITIFNCMLDFWVSLCISRYS
ncbi:hypothetical protein, partial [Prevotella bivia]|uniref:hypothetical protein n=1 Tax=Prevotella bivia TaxID=28125 RepID=UPI000560A3DA